MLFRSVPPPTTHMVWADTILLFSETIGIVWLFENRKDGSCPGDLGLAQIEVDLSLAGSKHMAGGAGAFRTRELLLSVSGNFLFTVCRKVSTS